MDPTAANILMHILDIAQAHHLGAICEPPLTEPHDRYWILESKIHRSRSQIIAKIYHEQSHDGKSAWRIMFEYVGIFKNLDTSIFDWLPSWTCDIQLSTHSVCALCGAASYNCDAKDTGNIHVARQTQQLAVYCSMLQFLPRELAAIIGKLVAIKSSNLRVRMMTLVNW